MKHVLTRPLDLCTQTLPIGTECEIARTYLDGSGREVCDLTFSGRLIANSVDLSGRSVDDCHRETERGRQYLFSWGDHEAGDDRGVRDHSGPSRSREFTDHEAARHGSIGSRNNSAARVGSADAGSSAKTSSRRDQHQAGTGSAVDAVSPSRHVVRAVSDATASDSSESHADRVAGKATADRILVAIDFMNLACRSWHAVPKSPLNAFLGTVKFVIECQRDPAVVFVAEGGDCFRKEIDPAYKAHRPEMDPALRAFLGQAQLVLSAIGWPVISVAGFEADDLLASLAVQLRGVVPHVGVATTDKDLWQLVGTPGVTIFNPYGDDRGAVSRADVLERWGVQPELLGDLLALTGDDSDGVAGVDGVGPKTAAKLLNECKTLAAVIARSQQLATVKGAKAVDRNIAAAASAGAIERSRRLVELRRDVELPPIDLSRPARRPLPGWSDLIAVDMKLPGVAASLAAWFGPELARSTETRQSLSTLRPQAEPGNENQFERSTNALLSGSRPDSDSAGALNPAESAGRDERDSSGSSVELSLPGHDEKAIDRDGQCSLGSIDELYGDGERERGFRKPLSAGSLFDDEDREPHDRQPASESAARTSESDRSAAQPAAGSTSGSENRGACEVSELRTDRTCDAGDASASGVAGPPIERSADPSGHRVTEAVARSVVPGSKSTSGLANAFEAYPLGDESTWPLDVKRVASLGCEILAGPNPLGSYLGRTPGGKLFSIYTAPLADESKRLMFSLTNSMSIEQMAERITATRKAAA